VGLASTKEGVVVGGKILVTPLGVVEEEGGRAIGEMMAFRLQSLQKSAIGVLWVSRGKLKRITTRMETIDGKLKDPTGPTGRLGDPTGVKMGKDGVLTIGIQEKAVQNGRTEEGAAKDPTWVTGSKGGLASVIMVKEGVFEVGIQGEAVQHGMIEERGGNGRVHRYKENQVQMRSRGGLEKAVRVVAGSAKGCGEFETKEKIR